MYKFKIISLVLVMLSLVLWVESTAFCQSSPDASDTTRTTPANVDSTFQYDAMVSLDGDVILEDITIEAIIEKPRVSILPKRIEPELGELEFVNRSFDRELKSFPENSMVQDDRLFAPKKIENLKKKLAKDNEKNGKQTQPK